ncbi:hypothetical protein [Staphylococcus delphini]|uniref:hypothetical protein n=1 Tax=Staphylococcus delphini TaxID=53344 RepID=UPI003364DE75
MTIAESEHNMFNRLMNEKDLSHNVINNQNLFKQQLLRILIEENDLTSVTFLKKTLEQIESQDIYILPMGEFIMYFTKDFKSCIAFALRIPNPDHAECFNADSFIEIDAVHSNKKGHGSYLMNLVIEIADAINKPVALWSETSKNTNYFKKYKLKSYGKRGRNKEELLIRKQIPIA